MDNFHRMDDASIDASPNFTPPLHPSSSSLVRCKHILKLGDLPWPCPWEDPDWSKQEEHENLQKLPQSGTPPQKQAVRPTKWRGPKT
eukprot:1152148-Pelagomonas_calceolata.AAC.4